MKLITHNIVTVGKGFDKIVWTPVMLEILVENYERLTNHQLAAVLQLRITSVRMKLYELGYKRMEMEYWTEEQVAFLVANFRTMGDVPMAEHFEKTWPKIKTWTCKHIRKKRCYLNLHRTKEEARNCVAINVANGRYADCAVKRWKTTGQAPVGTIRTWKSHHDNYSFKVIKLDTGWVHYAPWLWQELHGPVPEGFMMAFKDNDSLNVVPENLEIVTRAEHARRSRSYPSELREVVKLFNTFKNKIKSLEDGQSDKEEHQ